ncbi:MAG: hypothetical protein AAGI34_17880 [Pseudomonadota bacterium]
MLLTLIAAIACGFGAAGLVLLAPKLFGKRAPRWLVPAAAGIAMFAFMLWENYSWYERARLGLPEGVVVARTYPHAGLLQPWTYLVPKINRFDAVDRSGARTHPEAPDVVLADVLLVQRFAGTLRLAQLFDCASARYADPDEAALADPTAAAWKDAPAPLIAAACDTG